MYVHIVNMTNIIIKIRPWILLNPLYDLCHLPYDHYEPLPDFSEICQIYRITHRHLQHKTVLWNQFREHKKGFLVVEPLRV